MAKETEMDCLNHQIAGASIVVCLVCFAPVVSYLAVLVALCFLGYFKIHFISLMFLMMFT